MAEMLVQAWSMILPDSHAVALMSDAVQGFAIASTRIRLFVFTFPSLSGSRQVLLRFLKAPSML